MTVGHLQRPKQFRLIHSNIYSIDLQYTIQQLRQIAHIDQRYQIIKLSDLQQSQNQAKLSGDILQFKVFDELQILQNKEIIFLYQYFKMHTSDPFSQVYQKLKSFSKPSTKQEAEYLALSLGHIHNLLGLMIQNVVQIFAFLKYPQQLSNHQNKPKASLNNKKEAKSKAKIKNLIKNQIRHQSQTAMQIDQNKVQHEKFKQSLNLGEFQFQNGPKPSKTNHQRQESFATKLNHKRNGTRKNDCKNDKQNNIQRTLQSQSEKEQIRYDEAAKKIAKAKSFDECIRSKSPQSQSNKELSQTPSYMKKEAFNYLFNNIDDNFQQQSQQRQINYYQNFPEKMEIDDDQNIQTQVNNHKKHIYSDKPEMTTTQQIKHWNLNKESNHNDKNQVNSMKIGRRAITSTNPFNKKNRDFQQTYFDSSFNYIEKVDAEQSGKKSVNIWDEPENKDKRKKAYRQTLSGIQCPDCSKFYAAMGIDSNKICDCTSRHRTNRPPSYQPSRKQSNLSQQFNLD